MEKWKQSMITVIGVSLASQIYFNLFVEGFIVAMSPLFFVVFLYLFPELHPIKAGFLVGIFAPLFRLLVLSLRTGDLEEAFLLCWPDAFFYFCFGILYYLLYFQVSESYSSYTRFFLSIFMCDFLSNFTELTIRTGGFPSDKSIFQGILLIAVLRTSGTLLVVFSINAYKSFLAKQDHEERYKKLMIMAAALNGELYFMNKNMVEIEDVMKKAFTLYRTMEQEAYPQDMQSMTLDIAKDVHEIKKDYIRVIQGIQEGFFADISISGMQIKDIVRILNMDIHDQIYRRKLDILFGCKVKVHFYVENHFSLMSVFRNLAINSIDAIGNKQKGKIELIIGEDEEKSVYFFEITDNGPGIKADDIDLIFNPGYSTKFDEETGDISRGVGLTLVKDLLHDKFKGTIKVESIEGSYSKFIIEVPKGVFSEEDG